MEHIAFGFRPLSSSLFRTVVDILTWLKSTQRRLRMEGQFYLDYFLFRHPNCFLFRHFNILSWLKQANNTAVQAGQYGQIHSWKHKVIRGTLSVCKVFLRKTLSKTCHVNLRPCHLIIIVFDKWSPYPTIYLGMLLHAVCMISQSRSLLFLTQLGAGGGGGGEQRMEGYGSAPHWAGTGRPVSGVTCTQNNPSSGSICSPISLLYRNHCCATICLRGYATSGCPEKVPSVE